MDILLVRFLIAVLVYFIGEKVIALVKNGDLQQILNLILIVGIVLYVVFGNAFLPIR